MFDPEGCLLRRFLYALLAFVLLTGAALAATVYRLGWRAPVPTVAAAGWDWPAIRRRARRGEGSLPVAIRAWVVARSTVPRGAVLAGGGLEDHTMVRTAYEVVGPAGSVVIDAGTDRALHEKMGLGGDFFPDRYRAVREALVRADTVVVTHLHPDHVGGIVATPRRDRILGNLVMNPRQWNHRALLDRVGFPRGRLPDAKVVRGPYVRLAPGVVLVKAAGHTPGSQMVYVRRADGEEYLFVGDVAWSMDNIRGPRGKPRLIGRFLVGEDVDAVRRQLRALHDLHADRPRLHFVVSHDAPQHRRLFERGLLEARF